MFSKVTYQDLGDTIAQVDRSTFELFINPRIWSTLDPEQKEYVLLHEKGHLILQSPDEYAANNYAVEHFFAGELTESEFNRKIIVLSELFTDAKSTFQHDDNRSNFDPITIATTFLALTKKADQEIETRNYQNLKEQQSYFGGVADELKKAKNTQYIILSVIAVVVLIAVIVLFKKLK